MSTGFPSGVYLRAKPYLVPITGYNPNEPQTRSHNAPVKTGVTILSGQVICLESDSNGGFWWNLADSSNTAHLAQVPHYALQDSTDKDVVSAGVLTGLDCSGQFELQTGYYSTAGAPPLTDGIAVTFGSTGASNAGSVVTCLRSASTPIIGILTGGMSAGPIDLTGINSEASNLNVVQLRTVYQYAGAY